MLRRLQLQGRMAPGQCSLPRSARRQAHRLPASLQMQSRLARTQCSPLQAMSLLFPCSQVPMYLQCSARGQWPTLHQLQIQCRRPCCMRRLWAAVMLRECDESVAGLCRSPVRQKRRTSPVTCMWLRALQTTGRWPRRSSPARIPPTSSHPAILRPPLQKAVLTGQRLMQKRPTQIVPSAHLGQGLLQLCSRPWHGGRVLPRQWLRLCRRIQVARCRT